MSSACPAARPSRPSNPRFLVALVTASSTVPATMRGLEITWHNLDADHPLVGMTLAEANLRATTGVYVIAVMRGAETFYNPSAQTQLLEGDLIGFMGDHNQLTAMAQLLATPVANAVV